MQDNSKRDFKNIIFCILGLVVFNILVFVLSIILTLTTEIIGIYSIENTKLNSIIFAVSNFIILLAFVKFSKKFSLHNIIVNIVNVGIIISIINIIFTTLARGEIFNNGIISFLSYAFMYDLSKRNINK